MAEDTFSSLQLTHRDAREAESSSLVHNSWVAQSADWQDLRRDYLERKYFDLNFFLKRFDESPDQSVVQEFLSFLHKTKGTAKNFELEELSTMACFWEDQLKSQQSKTTAVDVTKMMLSATEQMKNFV